MTYTVGQLAPRLRDLADKVASFTPDDKVPRPLIDPLSELERWADKHKNDPRSRSCIDRIEEQAASNEETFLSMMTWLRLWDKTDDQDKIAAARTRIEESPLSVTRKGNTIEIQESWGGPSDGYEIEVDGYTVERARYYFRDWFDGAWLDIEERDYPGTWAYLEYWASAEIAEEE
jgi:hypothetical protein